MKYLVSLTAKNEKTKSVVIKALNYEQLRNIAGEEYPKYEIGRVTNDEKHIKHFEQMKRLKGSGKR